MTPTDKTASTPLQDEVLRTASCKPEALGQRRSFRETFAQVRLLTLACLTPSRRVRGALDDNGSHAAAERRPFDAEMSGVPGRKLLGVLGAEEHAADARHPFHAAPCSRPSLRR